MKREQWTGMLLAATVRAGLFCLVLGTASAQLREPPRSPWLLEIDTSYSVRHRELTPGLRRQFIQPMRNEKRDDQPQRPNQWFLQWEEEGDDALYFRFYFAPQGFEGPPTPEPSGGGDHVL